MMCVATVNNFYFWTVFFVIFYVFRCHVFHLCVTFDSQRCVSTRSIAFRLALTALTAASKSWWPRQRSWWSWRWSWLQLIDQNDRPMIMILVMAQTNWSPDCAAQKWIPISSCLTSWAGRLQCCVNTTQENVAVNQNLWSEYLRKSASDPSNISVYQKLWSWLLNNFTFDPSGPKTNVTWRRYSALSGCGTRWSTNWERNPAIIVCWKSLHQLIMTVVEMAKKECHYGITTFRRQSSETIVKSRKRFFPAQLVSSSLWTCKGGSVNPSDQSR